MSGEKYATSLAEKPFWLRPPWAVLFDLIRLQRVRPWDVNLTYLLTTLLNEIGKRGYIDFKASGIALLSSSIIYRMKSELVLELQEPPEPPMDKTMDFLPPPIQLPYRFEYTSTTIENLIGVLEESLKAEIIEAQPKLTPIMPAPFVILGVDQFMVDIEERIEEAYKRILKMAKEERIIPLSKLTSGLKRLEVIRMFLLVLFIACRGKIQLWQEEDFGEIYLSIKRDSLNDSEARVKT